jgi:hypothetical protein
VRFWFLLPKIIADGDLLEIGRDAKIRGMTNGLQPSFSIGHIIFLSAELALLVFIVT